MTRAATCRRPILAAGLAALAAYCTGCGTPSLHQARSEFYSGHFDLADKTLSTKKTAQKDAVLVLMERGTIRQARRDYTNSSRDFIDAAADIERLQTYSVSKGGASMVVNDTVQSYKGAPFERTLLHAFTAKNHMALGNWENAAVEARRLIESLLPEARRDYPEDAYSRYMAGFCLEMIGDPSNASLQYSLADKLSKGTAIDRETGRLAIRPPPPPTNDVQQVRPVVWDRSRRRSELVCFVMLGRSPTGEQVQNQSRSPDLEPFAEISVNGSVLGRSFCLADTMDLAFATRQKEAMMKTVKTVARVATKETIAHELEEEDELLGFLARLILIGILERPDTRRWETLPRWLQVARVPCPPDLKEFDVTVRTQSGGTMKSLHVVHPMQRNGSVFVSFCRDLQPQ